ncbi:MaoC family dehydratase [Henriciella mobilis]|uniref:MaoC family dehydratase n=1 Tax=Henriciella mobilis TaxID=2305467 RepID=A0A399R539_9PROT|nr:MaoC family dehydratase [Henriciella mobilis]RIJ14829.1 MaoC family dehydratase [Henriciella mobilis]RIJ21784.1 MaoC family dehydratase [Henriciella mobilis]RIJ26716.1 MaoC family dehydratase [Henriciella mobilis]
MKYFEDLEIGTITRSPRSYEVTREEVIEFAGKYDPQPFHLDDEAAKQTFFGRLSASGWHTAAMTMRLMVETFQAGEPQAGLGSPGIDELKWIKPVYPGDTLRTESELISKRRMKSRPDMGLTKSETRVFNQDDELVMSMIGNGLIRVRDPDAPVED